MYIKTKQLGFKDLRRDEEAPISAQGQYTCSGHFDPSNAAFEDTTAQTRDPKRVH